MGGGNDGGGDGGNAGANTGPWHPETSAGETAGKAPSGTPHLCLQATVHLQDCCSYTFSLCDALDRM